MVIELSGEVEFGLKSCAWFQNRTSVQPKLHDAKFNNYFYYSHFEIAEFSQYQYIIHLVAGLLKREIKRLFYIFIFWTETMRYTAVAKMMWFKTELM